MVAGVAQQGRRRMWSPPERAHRGEGRARAIPPAGPGCGPVARHSSPWKDQFTLATKTKSKTGEIHYIESQNLTKEKKCFTWARTFKIFRQKWHSISAGDREFRTIKCVSSIRQALLHQGWRWDVLEQPGEAKSRESSLFRDWITFSYFQFTN